MRLEPRYKKDDRIGGRYQVHKVLIGGMGEVYLCQDLEESYPLALKTFQKRYLTDAQQLRRAFEQEIATWIALEKHPNIVRCFYMKMLDNQPFMVLEWITGEKGKGSDLRSWLRRGPLNLKMALEIVIGISNGLLHAQTKQTGLVHRDLKPENILMAQGGLAKITDFGLAQIVQATGLEVGQVDDPTASRQNFVIAKGIAGTPAYMAPEQWRGEGLDQRADIYALGCILYEMLTGACPFSVAFTPTTPQNTQAWLRAMQSAHEQSPIPTLPAILPVALNALLQCCLAKTPNERYTNVSDVVMGLVRIYQTHFDQPAPPPPTPGMFTAGDYNNRGNSYLNLRNYQAALADYVQAITLDPNDAQIYSNRGNTYVALGQHEAALADYKQAIALDPNDAQIYSSMGNTYIALGQHEAALANHNQAITLDPNDAQIYSNRGLAYAALGQNEMALADYAQAIALDPNDAQVYFNRGVTYHNLSRHDQALADYAQAITLDPYYAKAYFNRGTIYADLGQHKAALADYSQAIDLDSTNAKAYFNRGLTYADLGQHKAALVDFTHALTIDPTFAQAYSSRGNTYHLLGQHKAALADYSQAIDLDSTDAQAYFNRGLAYAALGQHEAALVDFTHALILDPTFTQAYYSRGYTYHSLDQYEAALTDYSHALTIDPTNTLAYRNSGEILAYQGRLQEALPYFEKAAHLGDPQSAQYAAQARQKLGLAPTPPIQPVQAAFAAFQQADSLAAMQQAVTRYPLLLQPDFIAAIEHAIAEEAPPEHRPALTQRLTWLRQIANTQHPRSNS